MKRLLSLLCGIALSFSVGTAFATTFSVDAQLNSSTSGSGLDTGINLSSGDLFRVTVNPNDLWSAGERPRWSNADGLTHNLFATGSDESKQLAGTLIGQDFGLYSQGNLTAPYGALVGKLSSTFFLLGTNFFGPAPATGTLELYYWDINNYDNSEQVRADVQPVPEPGTMVLLGLGMFGLAIYGKRRMSNSED